MQKLSAVSGQPKMGTESCNTLPRANGPVGAEARGVSHENLNWPLDKLRFRGMIRSVPRLLAQRRGCSVSIFCSDDV